MDYDNMTADELTAQNLNDTWTVLRDPGRNHRHGRSDRSGRPPRRHGASRGCHDHS